MTPEPDELVETVAKALADADAKDYEAFPISAQQIRDDWPEFMDGAQAAIAAVREWEKGRAPNPSEPLVELVLPCDVKLPPATIIKAGCSFGTLFAAIDLDGRPEHFAALPAPADDVVEALRAADATICRILGPRSEDEEALVVINQIRDAAIHLLGIEPATEPCAKVTNWTHG